MTAVSPMMTISGPAPPTSMTTRKEREGRFSISLLKTGTSILSRFFFPSCLKSFYCRLLQNRKSAKKCRLKKKAEFGQMRGDVTKLLDENKLLKDRVSTATI